MAVTSRNPKLIVDLKKLRHNIQKANCMFEDVEIELAAVIKGFNGIPELVEQYERAGVTFIASSRLEQLEPLKDLDIQTPLMMIRIPGLSEVPDVIRITDISLNSEIEVLKELNDEARRQDRKHQVILMVDLGDLREGFWDRDELLEAALMVENDLYNLELAGIGTNLGCYGAIAATPEKLKELIECAEMIEEKIGRELQYISGGASTSMSRVLNGDMPKRINMLRVGEALLIPTFLEENFGSDISMFYKDVFTLRAEVLEVKDKPTYPVGEITVDAFGNKPDYVDRGIRRRALLGIGKVDYAFPEKLMPRLKGIEVLGASSDHTILDVEDAEVKLEVGDYVDFDLCYATMVYATNSANIEKVFV